MVIARAILLTLDNGTLHPVVREILLAFADAIGFVFVILGNSELFTEHTSPGVFPVLSRDSTIVELLRSKGGWAAAHRAARSADRARNRRRRLAGLQQLDRVLTPLLQLVGCARWSHAQEHSTVFHSLCKTR